FSRDWSSDVCSSDLLVDTAPPTARLLAHVQSYYWYAAQTSTLALGLVDAPTLLHHEETACFARDHVATLLGGRADDARLAALGYIERDGVWWKRSPTQEYASAPSFYQPVASTSYDGARVEVEYDAYAVAATATIDAVGNRTNTVLDYHSLLPRRVEDANGTIVEVDRDPLGVIIA